MLLRLISAGSIAFALVATFPRAVEAEAGAGVYLAARQAGFDNNFSASAEYFSRALIGDPENPGLLENALTSYLSLGDFDEAAPLARRQVALGVDSPNANLVLMADAARKGNWDAIFDQLANGRSVGALIDGLSQAWGALGDGKMTRALDSFDEVIEIQGLRGFGLYHKALALASVGDFEGADAIFALPVDQGMQRTRRSALAHAEVLSQLGRNPDAAAMLRETFGPDPDPEVSGLLFRLDAGEPVPYTFVKSAAEGIAEVFYSVAVAIQPEADEVLVLYYARAAEATRPTHAEAIILAGQMLTALDQFDLANAAFARVNADDPAYYSAELGRAEALDAAGKTDAAVEVMQALSRSHGDLPLVQASLGDMLRRAGDMKGANAAYTVALDLYDDKDPSKWFIYYMRGITYERLGDWPPAEADFRTSLALRPGQPSVLNYLGYSLVEMQTNLDEALSMIQEAVARDPDNGAIVDSLGWALYRLGRYDEAVGHMERAAALEPVDPIVNDHLGDVFWAVGRENEARFQWQRALSFGPEDAEATRIRRKLAIGLDAVLTEEGAPPLGVPRENR